LEQYRSRKRASLEKMAQISTRERTLEWKEEGTTRFEERMRQDSIRLKNTRGYHNLSIDQTQKSKAQSLLQERIESQKNKVKSNKVLLAFDGLNGNVDDNHNDNSQLAFAHGYVDPDQLRMSKIKPTNSALLLSHLERPTTESNALQQKLQQLLSTPEKALDKKNQRYTQMIEIVNELGFLVYEPSRKEIRKLRREERRRRKLHSNKNRSSTTDSESESGTDTESDIDLHGSDAESQKSESTPLDVDSLAFDMSHYFADKPPNTFNMNNQDIMVEVSSKNRGLLQSIIARAIVDCKSLQFVKMCNALVDDVFLEKVSSLFLYVYLYVYAKKKKKSTYIICNELSSWRAQDSNICELWLDSNVIGDAGIQHLSRFIATNSQITAIKLQCNKCNIHTNVCEELLKALEMNHCILKFEFEFRHIQHRDKLQKILWRNWALLRQQRMLHKKNQDTQNSSFHSDPQTLTVSSNIPIALNHGVEPSFGSRVMAAPASIHSTNTASHRRGSETALAKYDFQQYNKPKLSLNSKSNYATRPPGK
ncbi:hypothetical protein RFI_27041, partial [Reticulomyxa filosa]